MSTTSILSGDQLYSMDYGDLIEAHLRIGADMNLGTTPVDRRAASDFGIMHSDADRPVTQLLTCPYSLFASGFNIVWSVASTLSPRGYN